MAFSEDFSVSQSGSTPGAFTVTDTSTGADAANSVRRIYVSDSDGTYLTGDGSVNYDVWLLVNPTITLDVLTQDTAVEITVQWLNVSNTVLYELTQQYCLAQYAKNFLYELVQQQALTPSIVQDSPYWNSLAQFWANLRGGLNAIEVASDLDASQECLNRCTEMETNQSYFF